MPMEIENKSMEIIAPYLSGLQLNEAETRVYSRMIHASGDTGYAELVRMHPDAIQAAQKALRLAAIFIPMWKWCEPALTRKSLLPSAAR